MSVPLFENGVCLPPGNADLLIGSFLPAASLKYGVIPAAYHVAQSSNIFSYAPLRSMIINESIRCQISGAY